MLTSAYLLSQAFVACSLALGILAFLHPHDKGLKLYIAAAGVTTAIHFALLGAWVGAVLSLVGAARFTAATYSKSDAVFILFVVLGLVIGVWRFQTLPDVLPILGSTLGCVAVFRCHGRTMRWLLLAVSSCWLVYNALHYSVVGALLEGFYITTNLYNLYRIRHKVRPS